LRCPQCFDLRVRLTAPMMVAFTERLTRSYDHRTDRWIGRRIGDCTRGKLAGARHVNGIVAD
jgi:hypothetical protein